MVAHPAAEVVAPFRANMGFRSGTGWSGTGFRVGTGRAEIAEVGRRTAGRPVRRNSAVRRTAGRTADTAGSVAERDSPAGSDRAGSPGPAGSPDRVDSPDPAGSPGPAGSPDRAGSPGPAGSPGRPGSPDRA